MMKYALCCSILWFALGSQAIAEHQNSSATLYTPLFIESRSLVGRDELQKMLGQLSTPVTDARWKFSILNPTKHLPQIPSEPFNGELQTRVALDNKIIAFMNDMNVAAQNRCNEYPKGSEELFNIFSAYNPQLDRLKQIDKALEVSTAAWLGNPSGRAFFSSTATGASLRKIFSQIRLAPGAPVEVSKLNADDKETLAIFIGATLWRLRGAGFMTILKGTQDKRKFFVEYGFQSLGQLVGKNISTITTDFRLRLQLKGWGSYYDMGHTTGDEAHDGKDETFDLIYMTARGEYQVHNALHLVKRMGGNSDSLLIGGLQIGPCYFYSWREFYGIDDGSTTDPRYQGNSSQSDLRKDFPWSANISPTMLTTMGELCAGASLGLGIVRAFD